MTPPCYTFPAAELSERVQFDVHGRQRKMPPRSPVPLALPLAVPGESVRGTTEKPGKPESLESPEETSSNNRHLGIDLARDCTLLSSLVQYSCAVMQPEMRDSPVRCWPVQRMFRRCQDRHGSFTVETTAWPGSESASRSGSGGSSVTSMAAGVGIGDGPSRPATSASSPAAARAGLAHRPETLRVFG